MSIYMNDKGRGRVTNSNSHEVCLVRLNRHKIRGDDLEDSQKRQLKNLEWGAYSQSVVVDGKGKESVNGDVNETNQVFPSLNHSSVVATAAALPDVLAIDQASFHRRWTNCLSFIPELIHCPVTPILNQDRSQVDIIVCAGRSVNDDWPWYKG